jgi:uncharacterized protein (DUF2126 family)
MSSPSSFSARVLAWFENALQSAARPLGHELHESAAAFVAQDFDEVVPTCGAAGNWRRMVRAASGFRFRFGTRTGVHPNCDALEPWHVMGETGAGAVR